MHLSSNKYQTFFLCYHFYLYSTSNSR